MTNAEYKEFAKEVFNNLTSYLNVIKRQGINISNIGEIFLLAIKKGAEKLDKNIFLYSGADKMNNMLLSFVKRNEEKNPKNIGDLPDSDTTLTFINYYLFLGIRLAINNHSNPEYMLQNLGIENVQEFISKITKVDDINDVVTLSNSVSEIRNYINEDGLCRIFLWGIASHYGIDIIKFCKNESSLFVLCLLKLIKHIGDKYHSICKERVSIILSQLKSLIKNEFHNFEDFIPKDIINAIINNFTKFKSLDKIEELISIEFDKQKYILLDGLFIIYYYIYEAPQHIVKLGFNLMSDNVSSNISGAMISSFQKQDYAGLIQYEYEWWCKETGERLSLLFPFFEGQLDLCKINIVDYDLDKKKAPLQIIVKNDNLPQEETNSLPILQEENILSHADNILSPFYTIFEAKSVSERGNTFRKIYLPALAEYSITINDSYTLYGFAYLLYKSQYLNFQKIKFDSNLVDLVTSAFLINDKLKEIEYVESKAKFKAWQILNSDSKTIPMTLLSEEERKKIRPVKM